MMNVLFLCTGNSARSILAESLLNEMGQGRFKAYSAGSEPKAEPHPVAMELLHRLGHPTGMFRSKSWDEFAAEGAPHLDVIITVCDNAAGEACPVWPGRPATGHWGIADPAAVTDNGPDARIAFLEAYAQMADRIGRFVASPVETMNDTELRRLLSDIGDQHRIAGAA